MTVAATEGKMSTANFVRYFSIPATPRRALDAGTLRHIKGSSATDRWQLAVQRHLRFQLDFKEDDLACRFVEHIVFHARFAEIGFADPERRPGALPVGRHDGQLAWRHRNDDIVHAVDMR